MTTNVAISGRRRPRALRIQEPLPERYTNATPAELTAMVVAAKATLGPRVRLLGHHYQRDEVMQHCDDRGDSLRLSLLALEARDADTFIQCGVHFMAESTAVLRPDATVILPDLNAGCSMADMADLDSVEEAWEAIGDTVDIGRVVPVTYQNSSAALKAFVGRNGGAVCTSTNARAVLTWALERGEQVLFFPDQHLGRNTGLAMGYTLDDMHVWNPRAARGGLSDAEIGNATLLLWRGHCSTHQRFNPAHIDAFRAEHPDGLVVAHPECSHEVCALADSVGSTDHIIRYVAGAPAGATIGVATEIHLVHRLAQQHPDRTVVSLDPLVCPCSTMNRIDEAHLAWVLENLIDGRVVNEIAVDDDIAAEARVALDRMLALQ